MIQVIKSMHHIMVSYTVETDLVVGLFSKKILNFFPVILNNNQI